MPYLGVHEEAKERDLHRRASLIRRHSVEAMLKAARTAISSAARSRQCRQEIKSLSALNDGQLRDIGFDRAAAMSIAAGQNVKRARWQHDHE